MRSWQSRFTLCRNSVCSAPPVLFFRGLSGARKTAKPAACADSTNFRLPHDLQITGADQAGFGSNPQLSRKLWNLPLTPCVLAPRRGVMGALLQDLRYGARTLRKSPGFTLIAVIALALGIGANTAMFSVVNSVLLQPLPYSEPHRLLKLYTSMPQFRDASISYPNFLDWQQRSRSFEAMAAYRNTTFNLTGSGN